MNYLLDTNIVLIYTRDSSISKKMEEELKIFTPENNVAISVVTVGELFSIAKQKQYSDHRIRRLKSLLSSLAVIDINIEEIIEQYAEIDAYSQVRHPTLQSGFTSRNMGKNDLWIAATASIYDLTLLTTDQDFRHLDNIFLRLRQVDLNLYKDR
jgi:tRNA(fMet)-specific endonuclease VapC